MLTDKQRFSISLIRSISVILIVLCHIMQGYNNLLAWWLNVGVQIFLFMSGFLFGAKDIPRCGAWYKKRFTRILIPYYLYLIVIIPILSVFNNNIISLKQIICYGLNLQGIAADILSIGHLWFVTIIAICYLITPILFNHNISKKKNSEYKFYLYFIFQCILLQLIFFKIEPSFAPWIATYMFGYYVAGRYKYDIPRYTMNFLISITIVLVLVQIYFQYYYSGDVTIIVRLIRFTFPWIHAMLGSTIFIVLFNTISRFKDLNTNNFLTRIICIIDKYSYEIYITHHIYILGIFSLLKITKYSTINILIILLLTMISAFILKSISDKIIVHTYHKKN